MKIEIKSWYTGGVLFAVETESLRLAVELAVKARAHLRGANLTDADLMGANLTDADLRGANLTGANLTDANLRGAHLSGANLTDADLMGANLTGANLTDANLRGANLTGANLTDANLRGANLRGADLTDADLTDADLRGAHLRGANLTGANLTDANLRGANLRGANLRGAKNLHLPTGETWDEYLTETVPALLTAGGKSLESFAELFQCHSWDNCPMAHAFDGHSITDVPILLRPRAEQFVQLFDAKQIPWPLPTKAVAK